MTVLLTIIGLTMFYSWIHLIVLSFKKDYSKRTTYEKIVTWYAVIMFVLFLIGSLS